MRSIAALSSRVTYANVMVTVAVFIAMSGGAFALTSSSGGGALVNLCARKKGGALRVRTGKRCKKGERSITLNSAGLRGTAGASGPSGAPGTAGPQGAGGSAGSAGATGPSGATGATGPAGATPASITMLSENWGAFGSVTWTNQPAALTELLGTTLGRLKADLTASAQARLEVDVAAAGASTPAALRVQYSTDQATWSYLDGSAGPSVNIDTTGLKVSSWVSLVAGAKGDVFLRIVGINGSGSASPGFSNIILQVK